MIHTLFFHFTHRSFCFWFQVVVAEKVKNAMDKIELGFFIRRFWVVAESCCGANEDVAQIRVIDRKCDAVSRGRIIEKFLMELADFFFRDKID